MLDINLFRKEKGGDPELVRDSQRRRYINRDDCDERVALVDKVIDLDSQHREALYKAEGHRMNINKLSKEVGAKKKNRENADDLMAQVKDIKEAAAAQDAEVQRLATAVHDALAPIGNLVHDTVPVSDDEANNAVVKEHGNFVKEDRHKHNHVDLVQLLDIADLENGTVVAGGRGYYLKGAAVLLNQALISCALAHAVAGGATPIQTPFFMRKSIMAECAQLKEFDEALYHVTGEGEDKYLIATSEQPLCALHRHHWFEQKQLPIKYAGLSTCFRKEAGSHGRDTLGIFRIHQFEKVEQFSLTSCDDDASWQMLDDMLATSESFYQALGLPYRIVNIVSGELNDAAAKKYDLEAWFPGGKVPTHRELVSCSNCTDYQARNLEVRMRAPKVAGEERKAYVHMLNSTLTATERTLCCVLENYQTEDGVAVPEALQPYMLGTTFLPFKKAFDKKGKLVERPAAAPTDSADMSTS